jgi:hypothetical protein
MFAVNGILSNVGAWSCGTGAGTFYAILTYNRHAIFGSCMTYSASVTGTLTVNL